MNKFSMDLKTLRDKMREDENSWGIIPDTDDFNNPDNENLVKKIFGPYEDKGTYIFNILVMDMDKDPGDFVLEENIQDPKQFVDILTPILKNMGY